MVHEGDSGGPLGIGAYARHRGCSAAAVHKAIRAGRLRGSVVKSQGGRVMLRSAAAADREWEQRTDRSRRPDYARAAVPETTPPPVQSSLGDSEATPEPQLDEPDLEAPTTDPVLADYQRAAMRERARKLKLENDVREGQLIELDQASRQAFEFARTLREQAMNIPTRVAAQIAAESDAGRVFAILDGAIRGALEETAAILAAVDVQTSAQED